jgi:nucleoid-associated protein YgaU
LTRTDVRVIIEHVFARIVVIVALLTLAVAWGARRSDGAGQEQIYVVRAGDTLWSIAASHYAGDPREAVWRLEERNGLPGSLVQPGQSLRLP